MALSRVGAGARARGWRRRRWCGQLPAAARSLPLSSLQYRARSLYTDISPLLFISKPSFLSSGGGGSSGFIDLPERRARKRRVTAARQPASQRARWPARNNTKQLPRRRPAQLTPRRSQILRANDNLSPPVLTEWGLFVNLLPHAPDTLRCK